MTKEDARLAPSTPPILLHTKLLLVLAKEVDKGAKEKSHCSPAIKGDGPLAAKNTVERKDTNFCCLVNLDVDSRLF